MHVRISSSQNVFDVSYMRGVANEISQWVGLLSTLPQK